MSIILFVGMSCPIAAQQYCTAQGREDSIRTFLSTMGEPQGSIEQIINIFPTYSCDDIVDMYLGLVGLPMTFNVRTSTWELGLPALACTDSAYVHHSIDYLADRIIHDTLTCLLDKYIWNYFYTCKIPHVSVNMESVITCTKDAFKRFHTPIAARLLLWYYNKEDGQNTKDFMANYLYYAMASYVYSGGRQYELLDCNLFLANMWTYDDVWLEKCRKRYNKNAKLVEKPIDYFGQYRELITWDFGTCSPILLPKSQIEEIEHRLNMGIMNHDLECTLTKAFALITGSILPQDIEQGKELLFTVWPEMQTSEIWLYISPNSYAPTVTVN